MLSFVLPKTIALGPCHFYLQSYSNYVGFKTIYIFIIDIFIIYIFIFYIFIICIFIIYIFIIYIFIFAPPRKPFFDAQALFLWNHQTNKMNQFIISQDSHVIVNVLVLWFVFFFTECGAGVVWRVTTQYTGGLQYNVRGHSESRVLSSVCSSTEDWICSNQTPGKVRHEAWYNHFRPIFPIWLLV